MGAVYLGEHAMLGRPAAIKILLPALSHNREMVGRFFNEARATTAIRHPGIVEIYDFGFLPDGAAYIAMEMLDGESLATRLKRVRRLSVAAAIDVTRQVAAGLQAAHTRRITHRDLKPDNMFLIRDPEIGERVKLLDFGIAKLVGEDGGSQTRTGLVMGTPVYMSPEQCRGTADLDSRADLYSLGCVLYELVTGRPPFVAESAGDIIAHHLYFEPEPVRRHDPSLPEPLEQLIMALLAKDPARRPASAADVMTILDGWRGMGAAGSHSAMAAVPAGLPAPITGVRSSPPIDPRSGPPIDPRSAPPMDPRSAPPMDPRSAPPVDPRSRPPTDVRSSPPMDPRSSPAIAATMPTTLSGSAGVVAMPTGVPVGGRSKAGLIAIAAGVVVAAVIAIVVVTRGSAPAPTVAAVAPSADKPTPAPAPAVAQPAPTPAPVVAPTPAPAVAPTPAPAPVAPVVTPPAPAPATTPPPAPAITHAAPAVVETPAKPAAAVEPPAKPSKSTHASAPSAKKADKPDKAEKPAPREEPKAVAAPAPAPTPVVEVAKPAAAPAEPAAAPAAPAASKWGRLMNDKSGNTNSVYEGLFKLAKDAAHSGDCDKAREYAARIADKNVAMYRARVLTDSEVAGCLRSK